MQQSNKYTIPEMQAQIAQLTATMNLPGVPPDEIAIYRQTIARIQDEINARTQPGPVIAAPTPPPPTPIKTTTPPITNHQSNQSPISWPPSSQGIEAAIERDETRTNQHRESKASEQPTTNNQQPTTVPRIIAPGKPDNLTPQQRTDLQNAYITDISLNANPPTVTVEWPAWDWGPRTYTERDARGAFATCIRDLSDSKRAQQGRYRDLTQYMAWWRAIQYYRVLTYFWAGNPTHAQLQLNRRDDRFITIFNMVAEAAAQTQTQP